MIQPFPKQELSWGTVSACWWPPFCLETIPASGPRPAPREVCASGCTAAQTAWRSNGCRCGLRCRARSTRLRGEGRRKRQPCNTGCVHLHAKSGVGRGLHVISHTLPHKGASDSTTTRHSPHTELNTSLFSSSCSSGNSSSLSLLPCTLEKLSSLSLALTVS